MHCKQWKDKIGLYLDGELTPEEVLGLEEHLGRCRRCSVALEEARGMAHAVAGLPRAKHPEGLLAAIMGRIQSAAALPCSLVRPELAALVDGELEPAQRRLVEDHAVLCAQCGQLSADVRVMGEVAQRSLVPVRVPGRLLGAIFAATSRPQRAGWLEQILVPRRLGYAFAGAAAAVFLVLVFYLPRGGQVPPVTVVKGPATGTAEMAAAPAVAPAVGERMPSTVGGAGPAESAGTGVGTGAVPAMRPLRFASPGGPLPVGMVSTSIATAGAGLDGRSAPGMVPGEPVGLPPGTEVVSALEPAAMPVVLPPPVSEPTPSRGGRPAPVITVTARADFELSPSGRSAYKVSDLGGASGGARAPSTGQTAPPLFTIPF